MEFLEDGTFFLVIVRLLGAILISPKEPKEGEKVITRVSLRAGSLRMRNRGGGIYRAGLLTQHGCMQAH